MATTVVDVIKVELDNGVKVEAKPLKIKYLREFMARIGDLQGQDDADDLSQAEQLDILVDCCEIALKQYVKGGIPKDELEELLDMPTIYRIIEGASGIVLDDASPNPQ